MLKQLNKINFILNVKTTEQIEIFHFIFECKTNAENKLNIETKRSRKLSNLIDAAVELGVHRFVPS